jgi:hypothetical protein
MKAEDKKTTMKLFNKDPTKWIILCTFNSMSVALNLQRADHAIMAELSHKFSEVKQFFARICRRGQMESICKGFILVNRSSIIEQRMLKSTAFAQQLEYAVYVAEENADREQDAGEDKDPDILA